MDSSYKIEAVKSWAEIENHIIEDKYLQHFKLYEYYRYVGNVPHRFLYKKYLRDLGITQHPYAFYPANFWPHKNHRMLLTAYRMFIARNPKENIDLVLLGIIENYGKKLRDDARRMGLEKRVHFIGFQKRHRLAAVWHGCSFLIFPSLCETSFIHLLEAMSYYKPIICSDIPLFSEVVRDAALYFDPRKPVNIARRFEQILTEPSLRSNLIQRSRQRIIDLKLNESPKKLGNKFGSLSNSSQIHENWITGIYEDKWTYPEVIVVFKAGPRKRLIEFHFEAPSHIPSRILKLYFRIADGPIKKYGLKRGSDILISQRLPKGPGYLTVWIFPVFRPSEMMNGSSDRRILGCLCHGCRIVSSQ